MERAPATRLDTLQIGVVGRRVKGKGVDKMDKASVIEKAAPIEEPSAVAEEEVQESLIDWKSLWKPMSVIIGLFLAFFWLPVENSRFAGAVIESLALAKWYAQEHVLLCLVPAFFIAGAIACFVSQAAVMKYLGAGAKKVLAYGVASVSGTILAVCSCTVLPLFAGIWKRGASLGPAMATRCFCPRKSVQGTCPSDHSHPLPPAVRERASYEHWPSAAAPLPADTQCFRKQ
jgi:hypothetical protein